MQPNNHPQFPPPPPPPPAQPPLPPGWERAFDQSSGRHYYANRSTGETTWEPPLPPPPPHFPVPPPPPPPSQLQVDPIYRQSMTQQQHLIPNQQHDIHAQQHQQFNPKFPPPNMLVGQNTIPAGNFQQYPPSQPFVPSQVDISPVLPTTGKVGYQLDASTATAPGLLVPSVRSMITAEVNKRPFPKLELEGLTAGAIADLCNITTEFKAKTVHIDKGDFADDGQTQSAITEDVNQYYMPLEPFNLPVASRPQHIESGRVDIRLHALYSKLNRI